MWFIIRKMLSGVVNYIVVFVINCYLVILYERVKLILVLVIFNVLKVGVIFDGVVWLFR